MKHNNVLPNAHFRKHWQRRVKTWFDQPGRKAARRSARLAKAAAVAPRPVSPLRPSVHCQTVRYNRRLRLGRGFTLDEISAVALCPKYAKTIGITVDHRRKNRSEESFTRNVERLKLYLQKLHIFPRSKKASMTINKKTKKPMATKIAVDVPQLEKAVDVNAVAAFVLPDTSAAAAASSIETRAITDEDRKFAAFTELRKARTLQRYRDARIKRAKLAVEAAAQKK